MDAICDLAGEPERAGPFHRADLERQRLLYRPRSCEEPRVPVELPVEVDAPVGQEPAHDLVSLAETVKRSGARPVDAVLIEHRDVADREDDLGATARKLIEGRGNVAMLDQYGIDWS